MPSEELGLYPTLCPPHLPSSGPNKHFACLSAIGDIISGTTLWSCPIRGRPRFALLCFSSPHSYLVAKLPRHRIGNLANEHGFVQLMFVPQRNKEKEGRGKEGTEHSLSEPLPCQGLHNHVCLYRPLLQAHVYLFVLHTDVYWLAIRW